MPVDKVRVQHKFGIISHNHRQNLLERLSAPPTLTGPARKPIPCEITHDFILAYNESDPLNREKLDVRASQLLQRVKRRAGLLTGGSGKHVHIPRSWVELTLLARCKGPFREEVLKTLSASLLAAPPTIDNIPSLFLVCETVIEWIKELGNPIPETAWTNIQILTYYVTELCFWRVYSHALTHNLQGCDSFLSDLSWHIENLDFVRKVYSKFPDGEVLLRQLESTKEVVSRIYPSKERSEENTRKGFVSACLMHGLDVYQSIRTGCDPETSLSALLTTLTLLGTEDHLNTILVMKLLTIVCSKNYLALQILQAASSGNLPVQGETGVCRSSLEKWDWTIATEYINLLVHVAINGESSEIQKSAMKAGEMTSVRVDSAPVPGFGLLDLVALHAKGLLSPAIQYALQQALTLVHIHVKNDPLRKGAAHTIWSALKTMSACPSHRIIVGIAQNKMACIQDVKSRLGLNTKNLFEQMFENLADHYIPQTCSISTTTSSRKSKDSKKHDMTPGPSTSEPQIERVESQVSVIPKPGSVVKLMNTARSYPHPSIERYAERNNKTLQSVVSDQWYKELLQVFRAADTAHAAVKHCEEASLAEKNYAQQFVEEFDYTESEVCNVMDTLVVRD